MQDLTPEDVTAEQQRAAFLSEASAVLAETLDYPGTLRRVAQLAVPAVADWCTVVVQEADGAFRRVTTVHRDPGKAPLAEAYMRHAEPGRHREDGPLSAVRSGRLLLVSEVTDAQLMAAAQDEEHLRILRGLGVASCIVVPMVSRGRPIGALSFMRSEGTGRYGPADLSLAEDLAGRIALALDNARLYEAERTARAEAEAGERRYRFLADAMPQMVWTATPDGVVDYINQVLTDYCGWSAAEALGARWHDLVHPDDLPGTVESWMRSLRTGARYETEHRLRRRDGTYHWFLVRALAMRDERDEIVKWFGTSTDVAAMKETQAQLQEAVRARDEFLSIASHELKTPLTSLYLTIQGVHRRCLANGVPPDGEKLCARMENMEKQVKRLNRLIDSLLDVSRVMAGRLVLELEETDLCAVVHDAAARFREELGKAGCVLLLRAGGPCVGWWDRNRLDQVLTNLLSNAIKYAPRGPVEVTLVCEPERAVLTVKDHGIGIRPEDQPRIFGRFQRAVPHTHYGGLGLGLWIVNQIVVALGGRISVESEPGAGAAFIVTLPRSAPA